MDDHGPIYNAWEESVEAYNAYTPHALDASSTTGIFYTVPPCTNLALGEPALPATTVPTPGEKSCVDVKTLLRDTRTTLPAPTITDPTATVPNPSYGSLTFNILYYDDYKLVP
jgi:hypothetical protein